MQLSVALQDAATWSALGQRRVDGNTDVEVTRVDHDSREVHAGSVFACVPGALVDGHDYAAQAVANGAVALLCERPLGLDVPEVVVPSVREAMGPLAAVVAGRPSDRLTMIGITGTNGKTTTSHLLAAVLQRAGRRCGVIGTLTGARTTPEAPDLQRQLAALAGDGYDAVAMEVSSHALDQHRVDGTHFRVGVFTNLSRDHLDYHGDLEHYFRAKARLFDPDLSDRAVVNVDDPRGRLLRDAARIPTATFSLADAQDLVMGPYGSRFRWRGVEVRVGLVGRFNVANALATATAAAEVGLTPEEVAAGLSAAGPVPGRFELVDQGQPFLVVVDYAHTPDGLDELLSAARELARPHRVLVVFGAGGDRDRTKRAPMGRSAEAADVVVLTSDNPRSEDPDAIISDVRRGMTDIRDTTIEPDRRAAIAHAIAAAEAGDVVVIAGKGHETTQTIGEAVQPFDDREVARALLAEAGHRKVAP